MEKDTWIACAPFESLLHMHIHEAGDGASTLSMPFLPQFAQGAGLMHGGALVSLADTALAMAIKSLLAPGTHFGTIKAHTHFLAPVLQGTVTAQAQITGREGREFYGEAHVEDEQGRPVLHFEATFKQAKTKKEKYGKEELKGS
ncbi:MAG: PaaI family thioesterase [Desulfovermiculus sp.]